MARTWDLGMRSGRRKSNFAAGASRLRSRMFRKTASISTCESWRLKFLLPNLLSAAREKTLAAPKGGRRAVFFPGSPNENHGESDKQGCKEAKGIRDSGG